MSVANTYAKALFETAQERVKTPAERTALLDQIEQQLDSFVDLLNGSRELQTALFSPITNSKEKLSVVQELARRMSMQPLLADFLTILATKDRLSIVREIRDALATARLHAEGGIAGRLIAAEPMAESDVQGLAQAFSRKLGKKVAFRVTTDPTLLAGMKVTVNGVTYDGTLRSQLQRLRDRLVLGAPSA